MINNMKEAYDDYSRSPNDGISKKKEEFNHSGWKNDYEREGE